MEAAASVAPRMSLEEFLELPEGPPHYEFEQGEVIEVAEARTGHQDIVLNLAMAVKTHLRQTGEGRVWLPVDVVLPQGRVYGPDLVVLFNEHLDRVREDGKIWGAPDLVVEVISPGGERRDRVQKLNGYLEAGVRWYWLADSTSLVVEEYELRAGEYARTAGAGPGDVFRPRALAGLEIEVDALRD